MSLATRQLTHTNINRAVPKLIQYSTDLIILIIARFLSNMVVSVCILLSNHGVHPCRICFWNFEARHCCCFNNKIIHGQFNFLLIQRLIKLFTQCQQLVNLNFGRQIVMRNCLLKLNDKINGMIDRLLMIPHYDSTLRIMRTYNINIIP